MGKHGFLTPKAISNRIKAKGLQKLKFYCQMCQKQCRDENGFKCHTMSESHQRQLLLFADNSGKYLDEFSRDFKKEYLLLLKHRFNGRRVNANHVYQEYISDRHHVHMNATKWETLTNFVKYLGREGLVKADETEKGWFVTYIDRDPETEARRKRKIKMAIDSDERQERQLMEQVERAKQNYSEPNPTTSTDLLRSEDSDDKVNFAITKLELKKTEWAKPVHKNVLQNLSSEKTVTCSNKPKGKQAVKKRSVLAELIEENEAKKKCQRKDAWVTPGIVIKIITKDLGDDFYKEKAVILDVFDTYGIKVKLLNSNKKLKLDQTHVETVIPKCGRKIKILNGPYEGTIAILESLDTETFSVAVKIDSGSYKGRLLKSLPYEDVSKLHVD